jgi:hypothetical protein
MLPGERPMTRTEMERDEEFVNNALPGVEEQTGLDRANIHFSIVHTGLHGGFDYIVARPYLARTAIRLGENRPRQPNPDMWWVWDADMDEYTGWTAQATFGVDGYIEHPEDPRVAEFDRAMAERDEGRLDGGDPDDGDDTGEDFPSWGGRVTSGEPEAPPRDPNAPVRATIDLDDAEVAAREGLPAWEEHERFGVLVNSNGFAVVFDDPTGPAVGIVRYPDKGAVNVGGATPREAREQAEKFLANRPYKNAYERVLAGETEIGEETAAQPEPDKFDPPTTPAVPRAAVQKREWTTTPISSGDEDD